nr:ATP-dependent sacrificial sulfur transferase LarE [Garciella nitratireducens]
MKMKNKLAQLEQYVERLVQEGICIAFSGGVDSSLILKVATQAGKKLKKEVYAITFESQLHPTSDLILSKKVAKEMGATHKIVKMNEFENKEILKNPVNRCYLCKKYLFSNLQKISKELGCNYVVDGTNADDVKVYRPGVQALKELGIISPLKDLGITKEEVRKMAEKLKISVSSRPAAPCMATRLPYNTEIDFDLLKKIERGEEFIKKLGFTVVRLRMHGDVIRIEVAKEDLKRLLEKSGEIIDYLKNLGFIYITVDLEGFRSGSMDIPIL